MYTPQERCTHLEYLTHRLSLAEIYPFKVNEKTLLFFDEGHLEYALALVIEARGHAEQRPFFSTDLILEARDGSRFYFSFDYWR